MTNGGNGKAQTLVCGPRRNALAVRSLMALITTEAVRQQIFLPISVSSGEETQKADWYGLAVRLRLPRDYVERQEPTTASKSGKRDATAGRRSAIL